MGLRNEIAFELKNPSIDYSCQNHSIIMKPTSLIRAAQIQTLRYHAGLKSIEMLQNMLHALSLEPPYILVAHSYDGLITNLYARPYPQNVGGVVFGIERLILFT
ncbi:hypothetical protein [Desertivirga xinjiangensis]|uniref:hypothetical protein n=1 Tax=Desertivirga xinjiangensis TaxID=539206 RepID=UPI00210C04A5|nr:hypothetical protein [Pedobacter xinjiangensis]